MATRLQEIVSAEGVAPGATAVITHHINVKGTAWIPDRINRDNMGFAGVGATTTTISVRNDTDVEADIELYLRLYHTEDRVYGDSSVLALTPNPWWDGGAGSVVAADAPINTFVFQPGGATAGPEVFASFATLYAAIVAARVTAGGNTPITLGIDTSLGAATIPAGTYDMTEIELVGIGAQPTLSLADGTVLSNFWLGRGVTNLIVINLNTTTPPVASPPTGSQFFLRRASLQTTSGVTVPFIRFTQTGTFTVWLNEGSTIGGGQTGSVFGITTAPGKVLTLVLDPTSSLPVLTAIGSGGAGASLQIQAPSMAQIPIVTAWTSASPAAALPTPMSLLPNPYLGGFGGGPVTAAHGQWIRLGGGGLTQPLPAIGAAAQNLRAPGVPTVISAQGGDVTVTPNGSDTISGGGVIDAATWTVKDGSTVWFMSNGVSRWIVVNVEAAAPPQILRSPHWDGVDGTTAIANDVARGFLLGYAWRDIVGGESIRVAWRNEVVATGVVWAEIAIGLNSFVAGDTPFGIAPMGFASVAAGVVAATTNATTLVTLGGTVGVTQIPKGSGIWGIIACNAATPPTVLSGPVDVMNSGVAGKCVTAGWRPSLQLGVSGVFAVDPALQIPKQVWSL